MAAAFADHFGQVGLAIVEFIEELFIARRLFERVEVAALNVFDDREFARQPVVGLDALNFNYVVKVEKGEPTWAPVQVFDDGRRTFIRFPEAMLVREAPALFVLRNKETQLVNYRVKNDFYVVDRLIDSAELRVGQQDQEIVRISRMPAGRR